MPKRALRPCNTCKRLSEGAYCPEHTIEQENKRIEHTKHTRRQYEKHGRNHELSKFYSSKQWRNARAWQLSNEPLCRHCQEKGILTTATQVDHIKPRSKGGADFDADNLQSLCHSCHSRKTRLEQ